jgi:hypothetical protein
MNKALLAAVAGAAVITGGFTGSAEARCFRTGHHWSCTHHRLHYGHRVHYRSWAAGYGYAHPYYSYGGGSYPYYGSSYSGYSGSSFIGPRVNSGGGP